MVVPPESAAEGPGLSVPSPASPPSPGGAGKPGPLEGRDRGVAEGGHDPHPATRGQREDRWPDPHHQPPRYSLRNRALDVATHVPSLPHAPSAFARLLPW